MLRVAVRCEDGDLVPAILEADCGIDDQALRPANAQVRVEEDDVFLLFRHRVFKERERETVITCCDARDQVGCG